MLSSRMWYLLCYLCVCLDGQRISIVPGVFEAVNCPGSYLPFCTRPVACHSALFLRRPPSLSPLLFVNIVLSVSVGISKSSGLPNCVSLPVALIVVHLLFTVPHSLVSDPLLNPAERLLFGVSSSQDPGGLLRCVHREPSALISSVGGHLRSQHTWGVISADLRCRYPLPRIYKPFLDPSILTIGTTF